MLLLAFGFLVIILLEGPGLLRKKMWRELMVFGLLLSVGMTLSLAQLMGIDLPSPTRVTDTMFGPVADFVDSMLHHR